MFRGVQRDLTLQALLLLLLVQFVSAICPYPAWNSSVAYVGGDTVTYDNSSWVAKWWTQGEVPGTAQVWDFNESCGAVGGAAEDTLVVFGPGDTLQMRSQYNVLVLYYNPDVIQNGQTVKAASIWSNPDSLLQNYIDRTYKATGGQVKWNVVEKIEMNAFPPEKDLAETLTAENFLTEYYRKKDLKGDYDAIFNNPSFDIVNRVNSGEIDAVFLMIPPSTYFSETVMAGKTAYNVNSIYGGLTHIPTDRNFVTYSFNYERNVGCMLENTIHMAEHIMGRIYSPNDANPQKHVVTRWNNEEWNSNDIYDCSNFNLDSKTRFLEQVELNDWFYFFSPETRTYSYHHGNSSSFYDPQVGGAHFSTSAHKNYSWGPGGNGTYRFGDANEWKPFGNGTWSIVSEEYYGSGDSAKTFLYDGEFASSFRTFDAKFDVTLKQNSANGDAGFLFNCIAYGDDANEGVGYFLGLNADEDRLFLAEINNGERFVVAEVKTAINYDEKYTFDLDVTENSVVVRMNGGYVPVLVYREKNAESHGALGFAVNGADAAFDNFNFTTNAQSSADQWYNYPAFDGEKRKVSQNDWSTDQDEYLTWWIEHLPKNPGFHVDTNIVNGEITAAMPNSWLGYIYDVNTFDKLDGYGAIRFPKPDTEAPAAPVNLSSFVLFGSVGLNWEEPADNIGVTRYEVYRGDSLLGTSPGCSFSERFAPRGEDLTYSVIARDGSGNVSAASSVVVNVPHSGEYEMTVGYSGTIDMSNVELIGTGKYALGETVPMSVVLHDSTYRFTGWSVSNGMGDLFDSLSIATTNTMTGHCVIIANIEKIPTYYFNITAGANGTLDPAGNNWVQEGDSLVVTATPDSGYMVDSIFVDSVYQPTASMPLVLRDIRDHGTVRVTFAEDTAIDMGNLILGWNVRAEDCQVNGAGTIEVGVQHEISAQGLHNYKFVSWHIETPNVIVADTNAATTTVTILDGSSPSAITANFAQKAQVDLTLGFLSIDPSLITMTPAAPGSYVTVTEGDTTDIAVTLLDTVNYRFTGWTSPAPVTLINSSSTEARVVAKDFNFAVVASFEKINYYDLNISSGANGSLSYEGDTTVVEHSAMTITATPDNGYDVDSVFIDGVYDPTATFPIVLDDITKTTYIRATFAEEAAPTVSLILAENVGSQDGLCFGDGSYEVGTPVEIRAEAYGNYRFVRWNIETSNVTVADVNAATTTATITNDSEVAAVTAIFELIPDCEETEWSSTGTYNANDVVHHNGSHWRAKWWTTGEEPGTTGEWGVWENLGTCN